jgi:hypothetical protein
LAGILQQDITDAFDERLTANLTRQRAFLIERDTNSIPFAMNKVRQTERGREGDREMG